MLNRKPWFLFSFTLIRSLSCMHVIKRDNVSPNYNNILQLFACFEKDANDVDSHLKQQQQQQWKLKQFSCWCTRYLVQLQLNSTVFGEYTEIFIVLLNLSKNNKVSIYSLGYIFFSSLSAFVQVFRNVLVILSFVVTIAKVIPMLTERQFQAIVDWIERMRRKKRRFA